MKHNKYILALAFASMLTLGSCGDDFLGKEPQGVLTPEALANAQVWSCWLLVLMRV